MAELSVALIVLVPLVLLTFAALYLLRLGVTAGELTEAARQRVAGFGMLLLYVVTLACLGVLGMGLYVLVRVLKIA